MVASIMKTIRLQALSETDDETCKRTRVEVYRIETDPEDVDAMAELALWWT